MCQDAKSKKSYPSTGKPTGVRRFDLEYERDRYDFTRLRDGREAALEFMAKLVKIYLAAAKGRQNRRPDTLTRRGFLESAVSARHILRQEQDWGK